MRGFMQKSCFILAAALCLWGARAETLLLRNATVHTVTGGVIEKGSVLVRDGKIAEVGENVPGTADEVVDLEGKHLYPGLIASATTLGLLEISAIRPTRDFSEVGTFTPDVQSWLAVNPDSELLPVARANGITHFLPVPTGGRVTGTSGLVAIHGWTIEEMTIKRPAALHLFWPSMGLDLRPREQARDRSNWKSLEEQAKERRARIREIDDFFSEAEAYAKTRAAGGAVVPAWEGMLPFLRGEIPLMIYADDYRQIKAALEWAEEREYRIIIAGGRDAWRLGKELAEAKTPVIYERIYNMGSGMSATPARDTDPYDVHFRAPAVLHEAGVKLILGEGLDADGATNIRNLPHTAAQAIAFGLPEEAALRAITLHPAEVFGVAERLGSIEEGKEATLFAATGDIFDIRSRVTHLWFAGEAVSLESRHTRLYEKYRNRPKKD